MKKEGRHLEYGDVLGVDHGFYQHFGVYIGDEQVIQYYPLDGDVTKDIVIHITGLEVFLENEEEYFVCDFSKLYDKPEKSYEIVPQAKKLSRLLEPKLNLSEEFTKTNGIYTAFATGRYKIYSPEETVKRAYSRLGETSYNMIQNNCEHFAIWCKTGIAESYQVNAILKVMKGFWNKP